MKKLRQRVRTWIVDWLLKIFQRLSRYIQINHPFGRAPRVLPAPREENCLGTFEGGKVHAFDNAIASGHRGGVLISGQNEVFECLMRYPAGVALHPGVVNIMVPRARKLAGTSTYLCTPQAGENFYHYLLDLVPRLWLLEQAGFTASSLDHVFINCPQRWALDPLLAWGLSPEKIHPCTKADRFQVDRMIVPDTVANYEAFDPWKARFLRRLFSVASHPGDLLLFCGRRDASYRYLTNEEELFSRLEPLGFQRVEPLTLSMGEQAALFSRARVIVGVHGATLANAVYAPENVRIFEIQNRSAPQDYFINLYRALDLSFEIISAESIGSASNEYDKNRLNFIISREQIEAIVKAMNSFQKFA